MTAPLAAFAPAHEVPAPVRTNLTPAREIAEEIRKAARELDALAGLSDMQSAVGERAMKEEASAFLAYLAEVARPLDLMLREILRKAADKCRRLLADRAGRVRPRAHRHRRPSRSVAGLVPARRDRRRMRARLLHPPLRPRAGGDKRPLTRTPAALTHARRDAAAPPPRDGRR
jgi:hypothetical protein